MEMAPLCQKKNANPAHSGVGALNKGLSYSRRMIFSLYTSEMRSRL